MDERSASWDSTPWVEINHGGRTPLKIAVVGDYILNAEVRSALGINPAYRGSNPTGAVNLSRGLAQFDDVELHHITPLPCISHDRILRHENVILHFLRVPRRITSASFLQYPRIKVQKELDKIKPDIVHGHHAESGYPYFAMTSKFISIAGIHNYIPKLFDIQKPGIFSSQRIFRFFERYVIRKCRYLTVDSNFMKKLIQPLTRAQVIQIPNCVHESFFSSGQWQEVENPTIVCVGALRPEKGLDVLLKAMNLIRSHYPDILLNVIGKGNPSIRQKSEALVDELNLGKNVRFMGWLEDPEIVRCTASSWLAVVPSLYEPFGCTTVEAMAMGKPVVGSKTGGIAENILDGECGFLFPPGDHEALAMHIRALLENEPLRRRIGLAAAQRAKANWHPRVIAREHLSFYRSILEQRS